MASDQPGSLLDRATRVPRERGKLDWLLFDGFEKAIDLSFRSAVSLLFDLSIQD